MFIYITKYKMLSPLLYFIRTSHLSIYSTCVSLYSIRVFLTQCLIFLKKVNYSCLFQPSCYYSSTAFDSSIKWYLILRFLKIKITLHVLCPWVIIYTELFLTKLLFWWSFNAYYDLFISRLISWDLTIKSKGAH